MWSLFLILSFLLGLLIGSFLNVVICRYHTGRSIGGRSGCLTCGRQLKWFELVPLASFFCQRGRCRGCRGKISWQYPLVEGGTAILFALIYWHFSAQPVLVIFYWLVACLLMIMTAYDLKHLIIPDPFVFTLIALGAVKIIFFDHSLAGVGGALAMALPLAFLWLISRGRWLGFGDVKLALGLGLFFDWRYGLSALVWAFWLGALIGVLLLVWGKTRWWRKQKHYTMKSEVPFAPFLVLGFLLELIFLINVITF